MKDKIQLLPDAIANLIAAGEVIQQPSSVVKELLENALDAGSAQIKLIVKDAGKSLIQVIDNGSGMSETDARLCFERHATSKIREAKDLFNIKTMGFRGEAMASIAAVAQVEMRTRMHDEELGTRLVTEQSQVIVQEACQCVAGTNISVKNLFSKVPARLNFLKNNKTELRRIQEEFVRVALAHPEVFFSMHHNATEIYHLLAGNLRQRVVSIFGNYYNNKLVPVTETTDIIKISGLVCKPEAARKKRGEQFFFVNKRFIKSRLLDKAVMEAFDGLLPSETFPFYTLFIDIDPAKIDINVHPTKQEIKFDDERTIYNLLRVSVRHALGQYTIAPRLDFDADPIFTSNTNFGSQAVVRGDEIRPKTNSEKTDAGFKGTVGGTSSSDQQRHKSNQLNWQKLYEGLDDLSEKEPSAPQQTITVSSKMESSEGEWTPETEDQITVPSAITEVITQPSSTHKEQPISLHTDKRTPYQIHRSYIISPVKSGFLLIDQQAAHERILYEKFMKRFENSQAAIQQELFPRTVTLSPQDAMLLEDLLPDIEKLGFAIQSFGINTFVIQGVPAEMKTLGDEQALIDQLLEQFRINMELKINVRENMARTMARSAAIKRGHGLSETEMQSLIDQLFACEMPYSSPNGRLCFKIYDMDDLDKQFRM